MAVDAAVPAALVLAHAAAQERLLEGDRKHGSVCFDAKAIDPLPTIRRGVGSQGRHGLRAKGETYMDPRTPGEIEATGTLPVAGDGAVPLTSSTEPVAPTRPDWIDEARANLTVPGKYLAYEDSGRADLAPSTGHL